jgi:methyl-accepting chemotaxis protein
MVMFTSITNRIVGIITLTMVILGFAFAVFFVRFQTQNAEQASRKELRLLASREAAEVQSQLDLLMEKSKNLGRYFENMVAAGQGNRTAARAMIRASMDADDLTFSASTVFLKNAFDGQDEKYAGSKEYGECGRFTCWWYRVGGKLAAEPLPVFDQEDYYLITVKNDGPTLLEPYFYPTADGGEAFFITAGVPIRNKGKIIGASFCDMSLEHVQAIIADVRVFRGDYACLISPGSLFAAHPISAKIGKPMSKRGLDPTVIQAFEKGTAVQAPRISSYLSEPVVDCYIPIHLKDIDTPWYLRVSLPVAHLQAELATFRNRLICGISVILIVILILLYIILRFAMRPLQQVTTRIMSLASGDAVSQGPLKITSNDEIGDLRKGYNKLLTHMIEKRKVESDRVHITASLRKSEEKLHVTLDSIADGIISTNEFGVIEQMNPAAEKMTGWSLALAQGQAIEEVFCPIHARTLDRQPCPVSAVLESGKTHRLADHSVLIGDKGVQYHITDAAAPIRDEEGALIGVVLNFRHIPPPCGEPDTTSGS